MSDTMNDERAIDILNYEICTIPCNSAEWTKQRAQDVTDLRAARDYIATRLAQQPEPIDRARETSKRISAVEVLLGMGYQWINGQWVPHKPVVSEAFGDGAHQRLAQQPAAAVPDMGTAIQSAIERAKVFDDGADGADAESARSVVAILNQALASNAGVPEVTAEDVDACVGAKPGAKDYEEQYMLAKTVIEKFRARLVERMKGGGE